MEPSPTPPVHPVFTIGHSTRSIDEFIALLNAHHIDRIIDVRRFPGSKRYPQFGSESLGLVLTNMGIGYRHAPELGGRRTPTYGSRHDAWRSASFRAYADHMESPVFQQGLEQLIDAASTARGAIMCAEAVPWRCHRQLISDALVARGIEVLHILTASRADPHALTSFAHVAPDGMVIYSTAGPQTDLGL